MVLIESAGFLRACHIYFVEMVYLYYISIGHHCISYVEKLQKSPGHYCILCRQNTELIGSIK